MYHRILMLVPTKWQCYQKYIWLYCTQDWLLDQFSESAFAHVQCTVFAPTVWLVAFLAGIEALESITSAENCDCMLLLCRLPGLFENLFRPPSSGPGLQAYISLYNSIWLFVFVCVAYGVVRIPNHASEHTGP